LYIADTQELQYSADALNVLDKFHGANFIVYVEGKDDIVFWSALFDKAGINGHYVTDAGGISELEKIMTKIVDEDARVIAACDSDYSMLLNNRPHHQRIVVTYGHSIENTMYCPYSIDLVIKKLSRTLYDQIDSFNLWLDQFCLDSRTLVIFDIARVRFSKSIKVISGQCSRFLKNSRSHQLDQNKISLYIGTIAVNFQQTELDYCQNLLDNSNIHIKFIIPGHFLTHGVINFIKRRVANLTTFKPPTLSPDLLYALTSDYCKTCTIDCEHFKVIRESIIESVNSLKLI
jgi:hypothetical protein